MKKAPVNLDYAYAPSLKKGIQKQFKGGSSVFLDLQNVERASLACIQILIAARNKARKEDVAFSVNLSEPLKNILKDMGLTDFFEMQQTS